jgi:2-oxoisovalerate dehydrogenase E1 component alpha subunit
MATYKFKLPDIGEWDEERDVALAKEIDAAVRLAQREAEKLGILPQQGFEDIPSMFEDVFAEVPWHLAEQREAALDEAREFLGHEPE